MYCLTVLLRWLQPADGQVPAHTGEGEGWLGAAGDHAQVQATCLAHAGCIQDTLSSHQLGTHPGTCVPCIWYKEESP